MTSAGIAPREALPPGPPHASRDDQGVAQPQGTIRSIRSDVGRNDLRDEDTYCQVHGEASGPISEGTPCRLPHAAARCPVCSMGWIGPGPSDSVVLCVLTRHIVEVHPHTAHATTLRFNALQLTGSGNVDDRCPHDEEEHRRVRALETTS